MNKLIQIHDRYMKILFYVSGTRNIYTIKILDIQEYKIQENFIKIYNSITHYVIYVKDKIVGGDSEIKNNEH